MKKFISILLILSMMCLCFVACGADTDTDTDTEKVENSDTNIDTSSEGGEILDTDSDTDIESDTDTDSDTDINSDTDTDIDTDTDTDVDSDADSDTDTEQSTDIGSDENMDTDTDTDTGSNENLKMAPNFKMLDYNGNEVTLESLRGKPVVLNFWASWCPPCKAEMPDFEEAYQAYGEDIQFVMVSHLAWGRDTVESAKEFYDNSGYTFPIYFDYQFEAYNAYEINSIPKTFFIDENGGIVAEVHQMISRNQLFEYLERLK